VWGKGLSVYVTFATLFKANALNDEDFKRDRRHSS
jgi:hypothetical protein